ncbi:MAG: zinc-ribbon domain-containing protein [Betaproteobacteria bacterium]|nr:MAG: zinc-ribbon domain-containing protein [Betaproteobacteria bacterium]
MDLFTRCPHCETVFRVTTRHLQASGGQVRCGRCQSVFDAFASLTAKPPEDSQRKPTPQETRPAPEVIEPASQQAQPMPEQAQPVADADASETVESVETSVATEAEIAGADDDVPEAQTATAKRSEDLLAEDPAAHLYEWEFKPAPRLRQSWLWLSLSLLLVITGLGQAAYIFRTELMVIYPPFKSVYQLACKRLACEIELPRLRDQLNIEASDLRSVDPRQPNLVQLTALVRNRARVPVEYPAFELTLTNAQQQVVARRVFFPGDYLDDAAQTDVGLAGRRELAINMYLDTGPLRAAGYRIYLFYPPSN